LPSLFWQCKAFLIEECWIEITVLKYFFGVSHLVTFIFNFSVM
jgi:hypothetical protein